MRIHLLTFSNPTKGKADTLESIQMLQEAAQKQGHVLDIIYAKNCQLEFVKKPRVLLDGKPIKGVKVLIVKPTFGGAELDYHISTIKQFETLKCPVINTHGPVTRAKNKIRSMQVLLKKGIPMPKSYVVRDAEYLEEMVEDIGKFPVIIKAINRSQGAGVSIVESKRGLRSIVEMFVENDASAPLIVQEYIKESSGKDIRVFVVGGKIVAAMDRIAKRRGEFRSNFSLGGKVKIAELTDEEKKLAKAATKALGLDIAGVDLIRSKNGTKVLEVNSNPGLKGITQATGVDVAGAIIKYAVKCAKKGETLAAPKKKKVVKKKASK